MHLLACLVTMSPDWKLRETGMVLWSVTETQEGTVPWRKEWTNELLVTGRQCNKAITTPKVLLFPCATLTHVKSWLLLHTHIPSFIIFHSSLCSAEKLPMSAFREVIFTKNIYSSNGSFYWKMAQKWVHDFKLFLWKAKWFPIYSIPKK